MGDLVAISLKNTLATAGALGLLYIVLAVRVIRGRFKHHVSLGDGGNPEMLALIRAHGNFAEYVPLVLVMMGLLELSGANKTALMWCGLALVVGRVLQAIGVGIKKAPNAPRFIGTNITFLLLIGYSVWGLSIAFG
jgi:uncharacterized membrane protein YecN with MAPEG domain